jgi:predicted MPP superfamily phosphohydrolase
MHSSARVPIILAFVFVLFGSLGLYLFTGVSAAVSGFMPAYRHIALTAFWIQLALILPALGLALWSPKRPPLVTKVLGVTFILVFVPGLLYGILLLLEDIFRFISASLHSIIQSGSGFVIQSRSPLYDLVTLLCSTLMMGVILYGITKGKYRYKVHRVELNFPDLPKEFDGFSLTQISDVHAGSFDNRKEVLKAVELINTQKSDVIFFTGDLVNNSAAEMIPWIEVFNKTDAHMGKYSILGNHDYGDYVSWPSPLHKEENLSRLEDVHEQIGFNLMKNESLKLEKGDAYIELLGIENWGAGRFAKYGDLKKTMEGTNPKSFKILLSHDPSHWEEQVVDGADHIQLTLSGHTHGMQFGFEFKGLKFSPIQFRYPRWAGLYKKNERYLYVNRGFGFLGFPGRVGIWPEITVITLKRGG